MRIQVSGRPGVVIADLGDYGAAIDLSVRGIGGWQSTRLTMRQAKKLASELVRMTTRAQDTPPRAQKGVAIAPDGSRSIQTSSRLEKGLKRICVRKAGSGE